tara:strand:- start:246 stop:497 length:252 start_codon:yes stop_codon:yes gene_type:complete
MRTTVTIDPDTEVLLKEAARESGRSFKVVLNEAIRSALGKRAHGKIRVEPLFSVPFPRHLNGANFNQLADEWEDDETLRELHR